MRFPRLRSLVTFRSSLVVIGLTAVAVAVGSVPAFPQAKQVVAPPGSLVPGIPFSPGIRSGDLFYVAGTMATDPTGKVVAGGMEAQTRKTLENIGAILKTGGMEFRDVVSVNVYIADAREFEAMNRAYREFFPNNPPVRATVETDLMLRDGLIEISAIAVRPDLRREIIAPAGWSTNALPYSSAIKVGDYLFVAGIVSQDPQTGQPVAGDTRTQTKQILDNAKVLVEAAGFKMSDITASRVWLTDSRDFQAMNEVYRGYFSDIPPTRATVRSRLMAPAYNVEIMLSGMRGERQRLGATGQTPLSQAIKVGNRLFVSGTVQNTPPGDVRGQTRGVLTTIQTLLRAGGMDFEDVVEAQIWLGDTRTFGQMNEVYKEFMKGDFPARATVGVDLMTAAGLVEIAVIASK